MEIRNILILYNEDETTKESIVMDLQEEGYKHNFMFANAFENVEMIDTYKAHIDEVWLFGDCSSMWQYLYCVWEGLDLWQMS